MSDHKRPRAIPADTIDRTSTVIFDRIAGDTITRTAMNYDGSAAYFTLSGDSAAWVQTGSVPAWLGRIVHFRNLRLMRG